MAAATEHATQSTSHDCPENCDKTTTNTAETDRDRDQSQDQTPTPQPRPDPDPDQVQNQVQNQANSDEEEEESDVDSDEDPGQRPPRVRDTPDDLRLEAIANSIALHPNRDLLVCGDLDGDVYAFHYSCTEGETKEIWSSGHHLKSCRVVRFSDDGQRLYSVSKDRALHVLEAESGKLTSRIRGAHAAAINALKVIDTNLLATGDDCGAIKVWDLRKGSSIMDLKHHDDYISDITVDQNKRILLTTSGDGTMGVFHLKRRRFELLSEVQSGDLTSVAVMKKGKKVVCGSSEGTVYIFNWDGFGATSDRFALQAESVDAIVPVSDHVFVTAATDGVIRAVNLLPNRVLGCVGQHPGEPIEELALSHCRRFVASCAHDQTVRFWDVSALPRTQVQEYRKRKKRDGRLRALSKKARGDNDFFDGLKDEEEDKEDEEDKEEEEESEDSGSD